MMTSVRRRASLPLLAFAIVAGASCSRPDEPSDRLAPAAREAPSGFVNRVWIVKESSSIPPGGLYVFLGEGTLVMASPHATPAFGKWTYENGTLTMIEEGIPYRTEILSLTAGEFRIRSHNPGEPVDIVLVPASAYP